MVTKAVGFSVSATTKKKRGEYIEGGLTKEQALARAMLLSTTSKIAEIDREYEITDRYGEIDYDSKPFGFVKKVKRKDGYAYVLHTYDAYGFESWTYDIVLDKKTHKFSLRNRR